MLATFVQKLNFMMTREEILSIEEYCAEHNVSHRKRLEELNIPFWHFYKAKKKYRKDDDRMPISESSSNYHRADVSLKQCHLLALPENPAKRVSR